jgi:hypothetical protein
MLLHVCHVHSMSKGAFCDLLAGLDRHAVCGDLFPVCTGGWVNHSLCAMAECSH